VDTLITASKPVDAAIISYQHFISWLFSGPLLRSRPGTISVMTWNVAAVNNNPFEYWLEYDDSSYTELMVGVENILAQPGDVDVAVSEIFTEAMFQELKALMRQQGMPGVDEVEEHMWRSGDLRLCDRKIVSEFIKDRSLGSKRLISMPDRITNTIQVVTRAPSEYKPPPKCRPTVINNYLGDLSTLEVWWESWKRFMFLEPLSVRTSDGVLVRRPCQMLEPIPRSKYPAITEEEERLAIPLQILCQAIFDAVMVHLMHRCSADGSWQVVKSRIFDKLFRCKTQRTVEILETAYSTVDVLFLQEVAATFCDFFQHSALAESHSCILPESLDGKRDQNSVLLLSKKFFLVDTIRDVTQTIEAAIDSGVRLVNSDLVAVAADSCSGRSYLLASFHGDTAGRLTKPLLAAVGKAAKESFPGHTLILGLDANAYIHGGEDKLGFATLLDAVKQLGLATCFGDDPSPTTCCARTSLQPQLNKAISYKDRVSKGDRNPKDLITFRSDQLRVVHPLEAGHANPVKDNTGQLSFEDSVNFPTFDFPSDHAIVAALLSHTS